MSQSAIGRKLKPSNFLGALAIAGFGIAGLAQPLYGNVINLKFLLFGVLALPAAIWVLLANVWLPACVKCRAFFGEYELSFATETDRQHLEAALVSRNIDQLLYVLDRAPVPPLGSSGAKRYALHVELCENCKVTARARLCHASYDSNNVKHDGKSIVKWTELSSPCVGQLLARIFERNERSAALGYGVPSAV